MANLPENPTFEAGIYQIEVTDRVEGGANGKTNLPLKQLANRTAWLKQTLDALESGGGPFDYNASAGTLPVGGSDGAGVDGIRRKDYYFVTVAGTVSGVTLQIGDALIAKVDNAAAIADFIVSQSNAELATPTVIGMVKLVQNLAGGSAADAVLSLAGLMTLFAAKAAPALTGNATSETPGPTDNSTRIANTLWVLARLAEEATLRANAVSSEANARVNADNALANLITNGDNALNSAKANKSTAINANGGLQGGGDLSADRTLSIANGGVDASKLADNAVETAKIKDANVTYAKLAPDVTDRMKGNGKSDDPLVNFLNYTELDNKTYNRTLWNLTRHVATVRPYVRAQFQAREFGGGVMNIKVELFRNPNPDTGGTWVEIAERQVRLEDNAYVPVIIDVVDGQATQGDNYYRVVVTKVSGSGMLISNEIAYTIFGVNVY